MPKTFKLLSYNIHKGFNSFNTKLVLEKIRDSIRSTDADLVCLQEVVGDNAKFRSSHKEWPAESQFEFLADQVWPHHSYGKNAVYTDGHHGNAILSKYPLLGVENLDISTNRWERRGLLHAKLDLPEQELHVICTHLDLLGFNRKKQLHKICNRIKTAIPMDAALVIAGDFNDWDQALGPVLKKNFQMNEAFKTMSGEYAVTFPSWWPVLKMDRIYFKNLQLHAAHTLAEQTWSSLSDHLPLMAEFNLN